MELTNNNYDRNDFPFLKRIATSDEGGSSSNGVFSSTKNVIGVIPEDNLLGSYVMLPSRRVGRVYGRVSITTNLFPNGHFITKIENLHCFTTNISSNSLKGTSGSTVVSLQNNKWYVAGILSSTPYLYRGGEDNYYACFHSYKDVEQSLGVSIVF